ncbi:hypothetical protein [Endozoicomonas sp.]|uniref:hypothetical protein n=1 Tax=Endozoicomonas sp. TaxID=1892382 RepID=UPI003AF52531
MKKAVIISAVLLLSGCASTPEVVDFNGKSAGTYSAAAGCGTLMLDNDCSQMSGSTREIEIEGTKLRISGGDSGKIVFVMSLPKFMPDEQALSKGTKSIEQFLQSKNIQVMETKVMYGSGKVFGVHYTLDNDGYTYLKELSM